MLPNTLSRALLLTSLCLSPALQAAELNYHLVSLRAEAVNEIPQDLMHVTLYTEDRHANAATLAQNITQTLNQAITQTKAVPEIKVSMGNRHSSPVYDDKGKKIIAWNERAELRLESTDFTQLSQLTGTLLNNMNMASMRFSLGKASRQQHENQLLEQAIASFRERALLTSKALGGKDYRLVSLSLNSQGGYQPPMYSRMAMAAPAPMGDSSPMVEAGTTELKVSAEGQIEVIY